MNNSISKNRKNFLLIFLFVLFSNGVSFSQYDNYPLAPQNVERYESNGVKNYKTHVAGGTWDHAYAGKEDEFTDDRNTFRAIYSWSTPSSSIPQNAVIKSARLYIKGIVTSNAPSGETYFKFEVKQFPNVNYSSGASEQWDAITNSALLFSDSLPRSLSPYDYYKDFDSSSTFVTYIQNSFSVGKFHLAFRIPFLQEETWGTGRTIHVIDFKRSDVAPDHAMRLVISYTVPATDVSITADNNFITPVGTHGKIIVDNFEYDAPKTFTKTVGQSVSLTAVSPQTDNQNYQMIWHSGTTNPSDWRKDGSHLVYDQTYTFNAAQSDAGKTYQAQLRQIHTTTSGALSSNETWFTNVTLTGNVTIPAGYTMTIGAEATVNPNGYSITLSGGTLIVNNGATLNGAVLLTQTTYKAIYPTMQAALSAAVSGQTVGVNIPQTVSGSFFIVPSGVTLSFGSNAVITFSSGRRISVNGNLWANGSTFQGNGTRGSWLGISFNSGSTGSIQSSTITDAQNGISFLGSSGSVQSSTITNGVIGVYMNNGTATIQGNTITNNSSYGISSVNGSNLTVTNCTISNNGTGITTYSSFPTITGCSILNNTNYGINANNISYWDYLYWLNNTLHGNGYAMVFNNASPWIGHCDISDNYHGVVINSSMTNFSIPEERGYNSISCSITPLFKADNSSTIFMGYWSQGGYNSVFGSELPDMEARNNSGIWADNTYWGSSQPAVYADGTSWITTRNPLTYDPNPGSCSGYSAQSSLAINASATKINASAIQGDIATKYWEALSNGRGGNFQKAKGSLLSIIDGEFDHKYSPLALLAFYEFTLNEKNTKNQSGLTDSLNTGLNDLLTKVSKRAKGDSLSPYALRFLAREAALAHNARGMISYNNELVANYPNSSNELSALYDLTTHYAEIEQDFTKADQYYSRMVTAYPKEDLTLFAGINLGGSQASLKQVMLTDADQLPIDYDLSNAFPNPFNPITTITYQLPKEGLVTLKIYDILGNEVRTLVNEQKEMGKYTVQFDASSLASGMYIYRLRANDYTSTKKMLLLK